MDDSQPKLGLVLWKKLVIIVISILFISFIFGPGWLVALMFFWLGPIGLSFYVCEYLKINDVISIVFSYLLVVSIIFYFILSPYKKVQIITYAIILLLIVFCAHGCMEMSREFNSHF